MHSIIQYVKYFDLFFKYFLNNLLIVDCCKLHTYYSKKTKEKCCLFLIKFPRQKKLVCADKLKGEPTHWQKSMFSYVSLSPHPFVCHKGCFPYPIVVECLSTFHMFCKDFVLGRNIFSRYWFYLIFLLSCFCFHSQIRLYWSLLPA